MPALRTADNSYHGAAICHASNMRRTTDNRLSNAVLGFELPRAEGAACAMTMLINRTPAKSRSRQGWHTAHSVLHWERWHLSKAPRTLKH